MTTTNEAIAVNVKSRKSASKSKGSKGKPTMSAANYRHVRCYLFGAFIPALVLAFSTLGGSYLLAGHTLPGVAFVVLCIVLLSLSLSHVAESLHVIFGGEKWGAWTMAVVCDLGIVACELCSVFAPDVSVVVRGLVMVGVTLASVYLNTSALIRHADTNAKRRK